MSFIAACPHCQAKFTAQDHLAGKNVRCPKCKEPFRIGDVVSQAEKKAKAAKQQRRASDSSQEDLPIAKPAKPRAETPAKPAEKTPPPTPAPTRSWKEIAGVTEQKPDETPVEIPAAAPVPTPAPPTPAAPTAAAPAAPISTPPPAPPHATPPPDQPIVLNPTITAAWEALPPIILTTARHEAVEFSPVAVAPAALPQVERPAAPPSSHAMMFDDDLDDSCLDGPADSEPAFTSAAASYSRPAAPVPSPPPAPPRPAPQPPAPPKPPEKPPEDEVIELGFDDLVVERMDDEEVVELADDDFIDEPPPSQSNSSVEVITEVEVIEETPRRSSGSLNANPGPASAKPSSLMPGRETEPLSAQDDKRQLIKLVLIGGGGLAAVLVLIVLMVTLSGGSNRFEPSDTFQPTTSSIRFFDPSGKIGVQFPQSFAELRPERREEVTVRGANLVGKQETFAIYYSDAIPVARPPSGAKPIREHWLPFNLPELADESPYITSIRRHMIGGNYAVEYQLAKDIVRNQPGETRVLLIFIQQRMFVVLWAGDHYHDDVDNFFTSFTIDGEKFGDQ